LEKTLKRMTSAERKLSHQLDLMGLVYEREVKIHGFKADFWLPAVEVALEANGDWWHRTEMWKKTDAKKLRIWTANEVRFLGIWESRIDHWPEVVRDAIRRVIMGEGPPFWDWAVPPHV
jgi:very-short-patch-repair endonuclease